jgi:hypothetical protein
LPNMAAFDSSNFATIPDSVNSAADNRFALGNLRLKVTYRGITIDDYPVLKRYEQFVLSTTVQVAVDPAIARFRPHAVARTVYGTPDLWWLVLWSGGWASKLDFVPGPSLTLFDPDKLNLLNKIATSEAKALAESKASPQPIVDLTLVKIIF